MICFRTPSFKLFSLVKYFTFSSVGSLPFFIAEEFGTLELLESRKLGLETSTVPTILTGDSALSADLLENEKAEDLKGLVAGGLVKELAATGEAADPPKPEKFWKMLGPWLPPVVTTPLRRLATCNINHELSTKNIPIIEIDSKFCYHFSLFLQLYYIFKPEYQNNC